MTSQHTQFTSKLKLFLLCFTVLLLATSLQAQRNSVSPFETSDPLALELKKRDVYVGKSFRDRVDASALETLTQNSPQGRPVKIAVLSSLAKSGSVYGSRGAYVKALHAYLGLGQGTLFVVTKNGASIWTDALAPARTDQILKAHIGEIQSNPVTGIEATLNEMEQVEAREKASGQTADPSSTSQPQGEMKKQDDGGLVALGLFIFAIPVVLIGGGLAWAVSKFSKKQKQMREGKAAVRAIKMQVVDGIVYADAYLDLLPPSEHATQAKTARQSAAQLLDQASTLDKSAQTVQDLDRAEALLEQAKRQADLCRNQIDLATGGTGMAVSVDGSDAKATPLTSTGSSSFQPAPVFDSQYERIPENERGACFFCSRPSRISDLTPITIAENGKRRKVLACVDDVRTIQQGAAPAIRTVQESGRNLPWYQARSYDPYRDYAYNPMYVSYYDSGFWDTLFLANILANSQPAYYPIYVGSGGEVSASMNDSLLRPNYDSNFNDSPDFIPGNEGSGSYDGVASEDFFGGGNDFSSDSGGSGWGDSSGSDSSGFDFGGGDSGGGDFGGFDSGGGDFGGGDSGGGGGD